MLPIYVMWDSGLTPDEQRAIVNGLKEFNDLFPEREIYVFGSDRWTEAEEFSSADWYLSKAKRVTRKGKPAQLDALSLILKMMDEPYQKTNVHIDVMFTSKDLTAKLNSSWLNFCFGLTSGRYTVQSVARFRGLPTYDKTLAIKAILWHELGHVLGAAGNRKMFVENNLGLHCTKHGCIMRQGLSVPEFVKHAKEARKQGRIYCPLCLEDIKKSPI